MDSNNDEKKTDKGLEQEQSSRSFSNEMDEIGEISDHDQNEALSTNTSSLNASSAAMKPEQEQEKEKEKKQEQEDNLSSSNSSHLQLYIDHPNRDGDNNNDSHHTNTDDTDPLESASNNGKMALSSNLISDSSSKKKKSKTRAELNTLEKVRNQRINAQAQVLLALLEASEIKTKKDRYSILKSSTDYIQHLKTVNQKVTEQCYRLRHELATKISSNNNPHHQYLLPSSPGDVHIHPSYTHPSQSQISRQPPHFYQAVSHHRAHAQARANAHEHPHYPAVPHMLSLSHRPPTVPQSLPVPTSSNDRSHNWTSMTSNVIHTHRKDYETMFKTATIAMIFTTLGGKILEINDEFIRLTGFTKQEALMLSITDLAPKEYESKLIQALEEVIAASSANVGEQSKYFSQTCRFKYVSFDCFICMWIMKRADNQSYMQFAISKL